MKKYLLFTFLIIFIFFGFKVQAQDFSGKILLEAEKNGEAWYIYPEDNRKYYLGRPQDAFNIMRTLGLGTKHDFIKNTEIFPDNLVGYILLDVEKEGQAYYINPQDKRKYYLGRPQDAFRIMREESLGIKSEVLKNIEFPLLEVPFTAQAPFGNWEDPRKQDACEEASAFMAMKWLRKETELTAQEADTEILNLSNFQEKEYGEFRDASLIDIKKRIFEDYYNYFKVEVKENIKIEDIIREISLGKLVLVPTDGQVLNNPYFTPPGPERHMLVIRGYDQVNKNFIVNDPGTKRGELFNYNQDNLFSAIRPYPTGYHEPIKENKKAYIVVEK